MCFCHLSATGMRQHQISHPSRESSTVSISTTIFHKKQHQCKQRKKCFSSSTDMKKHMDSHSRSSPWRRPINKYECKQCHEIFSGQLCFMTHVRESGHRQRICDVCKKRFKRTAHLKRHLLTHNINKDLPYQCDMCNLGFDTQAKMDKHSRLHSNTRRHKCEGCGKRFIKMSHLISHVKGQSKVFKKITGCTVSEEQRDRLLKTLVVQQKENICKSRKFKKGTKAIRLISKNKVSGDLVSIFL